MYEWIKALHVIAVISWMAGMLYLPRLFSKGTEDAPLFTLGWPFGSCWHAPTKWPQRYAPRPFDAEAEGQMNGFA